MSVVATVILLLVHVLGWQANGTKLPSDGLWLNASKQESRLEGDDALVVRLRRAQLDGRWAVARADIRPYAIAARSAP